MMEGPELLPALATDGAICAELQAWAAMNAAVQAIRDQEARLGVAPHIITVQGTRSWARDISYYVAHPITAGGGTNIVYEVNAFTGGQCARLLSASTALALGLHTLAAHRTH